MANPQIEEGYTKIANEILEALALNRLSGQEIQIVFVVLRKTYGFNKSEDEISLSQFSDCTGINRPKIVVLLKGLIGKKILTVTQKDTSQIKTYKFQKDHSLWQVLPKKVTVTQKDIRGVTQKGNKVLPKKVHTKERKKSFKETCPNSLRLSALLADKIFLNNPKYRLIDSPQKRQNSIERWAYDISLLNRIDKQSWQDIEDVIDWCQADNFWRLNILSGATLRQQWDKLYLKMKNARIEPIEYITR